MREPSGLVTHLNPAFKAFNSKLMSHAASLDSGNSGNLYQMMNAQFSGLYM
jgi:hypothetical protein